MFMLVVELNVGFQKVQNLFLSCQNLFEVATLEKIHLMGGNQDPGDPGVGKFRGRGEFFSFQVGGGGGGGGD